ncbi:MAG TPA: ribosome-associated translation inhibitor RaiA [bacterium]|nr:ribosome-associated translation inhibitor RaiA [bacterium]
MRVSVTFRHMEPTEAIKEYTESKLLKVKRYLDEPIEANVVLVVEKYRHIAEVTLNAGRNVINCAEETGDIYSAIDMAMDKLERQIKKHKDKVRSKKGRTKADREAFEQIAAAYEPGEEAQPEWETRIVNSEAVNPKPIGLEEAVMDMDGNPQKEFLVFTNANSSRINVMYRRKDGQYGLIETITE